MSVVLMKRVALPLMLPLALLGLGACDVAYPEVVVVNRTAPSVLVRDPSFSGCLWPTVLAFGEATVVGRCLPGRDRVHFQKLDLAADAETTPTPTWFRYQTVNVREVDYGDFSRLELHLGELEQDFSVPGPYGH